MDEAAASTSSADEIKSKLQRIEEIDSSLRRLKGLLDVANRCDLNRNLELDAVQKGYNKAYESFIKGELTEAHLVQFDAYLKLFQTINNTRREGRGYRLWSFKYISFMTRAYGLFSLGLSILFAAILFYFLAWSMGRPINIYGVPLWASLFAGLGCCIQIIMGVVSDVRANGILSEDKHLLYAALPFVALISGYLAYILIDLGMLTLGGGQASPLASITATNISMIKVTGATALNLTSNISGNYTFYAENAAELAATGVGSFASNIGGSARIVACFLAGYATDDFIKNLKNAANKM